MGDGIKTDKRVTKTLTKKADSASGVITSSSVPTEVAIEKLNNLGGTIEKACRVLTDMMDANIEVTTRELDDDGDRVKKIVADHRVRHLGAISVLEIHKVIKDKTVQTSIGIFQDPTIIADAERVLRLRDGKK